MPNYRSESASPNQTTELSELLKLPGIKRKMDSPVHFSKPDYFFLGSQPEIEIRLAQIKPYRGNLIPTADILKMPINNYSGWPKRDLQYKDHLRFKFERYLRREDFFSWFRFVARKGMSDEVGALKYYLKKVFDENSDKSLMFLELEAIANMNSAEFFKRVYRITWDRFYLIMALRKLDRHKKIIEKYGILEQQLDKNQSSFRL